MFMFPDHAFIITYRKKFVKRNFHIPYLVVCRLRHTQFHHIDNTLGGGMLVTHITQTIAWNKFPAISCRFGLGDAVAKNFGEGSCVDLVDGIGLTPEARYVILHDGTDSVFQHGRFGG